MPQAPLHTCSEAGCNVLVRTARCDLHKREQRRQWEAQAPPREADPFLVNAPWRHLRIAYLAAHPLCADCDELGYTTPATEVHHLVKRSERPSAALQWDNLQGLCKSCHSRRTRRGE